MTATIAALTGVEIQQGQARDSVNVLSALTGNPKDSVRDHLVLSPRTPSNLAVRKGKWMYIGAKGPGGFGGTKRGSHSFAGPAAITYAGYENSDAANGRIKRITPPAQLYDLEADVKQTKNLYNEYPEVAQEMQALHERLPGRSLTSDKGSTEQKRNSKKDRKG